MQYIPYMRLIVGYRVGIRICDQNRVFWIVELCSEGECVVEGVAFPAVVISSVAVAVVADVGSRPHPPYPSSACIRTGIHHRPHA